MSVKLNISSYRLIAIPTLYEAQIELQHLSQMDCHIKHYDISHSW